MTYYQPKRVKSLKVQPTMFGPFGRKWLDLSGLARYKIAETPEGASVRESISKPPPKPKAPPTPPPQSSESVEMQSGPDPFPQPELIEQEIDNYHPPKETEDLGFTPPSEEWDEKIEDWTPEQDEEEVPEEENPYRNDKPGEPVWYEYRDGKWRWFDDKGNEIANVPDEMTPTKPPPGNDYVYDVVNAEWVPRSYLTGETSEEEDEQDEDALFDEEKRKRVDVVFNWFGTVLKDILKNPEEFNSLHEFSEYIVEEAFDKALRSGLGESNHPFSERDLEYLEEVADQWAEAYWNKNHEFDLDEEGLEGLDEKEEDLDTKLERVDSTLKRQIQENPEAAIKYWVNSYIHYVDFASHINSFSTRRDFVTDLVEQLDSRAHRIGPALTKEQDQLLRKISEQEANRLWRRHEEENSGGL